MANTKVALELLAKDRSRHVLGRFRRDLGGTSVALRRLAGAAFAAAGIAGLGFMIKQSMTAIDRIAKMSAQLQISTEALSGWEHAAKISGTEITALHKGIEIFVRRMGEARQGIGEGVRGLEMLGVTADEIINMGMERAFLLAADGISKMGTAADQALVSYQLFGRGGAQLLNMFQAGAVGIEDMRREAEKLNLTFSQTDAAQVEAANDALTRMKDLFIGLTRQLTIQLAPFIESTATAFTEWATSGEGAGEKLIDVFDAVAQAVAVAAGEIEIATRRLNALLHPIDTLRSASAATESALVRYRQITGDTQAGRQNLNLLIPDTRPKNRELFNKILQEEQLRRGLIIQDRPSAIRVKFDEIRRRSQAARRGPTFGGQGKGTGVQMPSFAKRAGLVGQIGPDSDALFADRMGREDATGRQMMAQADAVAQLAAQKAEFMADRFSDAFASMEQSAGSVFVRMRQEGKSFGEAMEDIATDIGDAFLHMLGQIAVRQILLGVVGQGNFNSLMGISGNKQGGGHVPRAGIYQLHGGEQIIQAHESPMSITLKNESGIPLRAKQPIVTDRQVVVGLVMEDFDAGGPMRDMIRGGR